MATPITIKYPAETVIDVKNNKSIAVAEKVQKYADKDAVLKTLEFFGTAYEIVPEGYTTDAKAPQVVSETNPTNTTAAAPAPATDAKAPQVAK